MSIEIVSTNDKVIFSRAVERRLVLVFGSYTRQHKKLILSPAIKKAYGLTRQMHKRFVRGVYLHTQAEEDAEQEIAKWLVERWHELNGTQPPKDLNFRTLPA